MADVDLWPPYPFDIAAMRFREHDAWWTGDTEELSRIYSGVGGDATVTHLHNGRPYRGGVIGSLTKFWIGQPIVPNEDRTKAHFDMPGVLARLSAALLFSERPKIRYAKPADADADTEPTKLVDPTAEVVKPKPWVHPGQDRLDVIMASDDSHAELLKSGEFAAALGGAYLAVTWDTKLRQNVRIRAYAADCAIPDFQDGILTGVTLWTQYERNTDVYRLLERHDYGTITFTLWKGGVKNLGVIVPLNTLTETAHYSAFRSPTELSDALINPLGYSESVTVSTGVDELAVVYYPNDMPQTEWRKLGVLANLGRSDFAGNEERFDNLDQIFSSLMRDVENGGGRVIIPESYLEAGAPGTGAQFDKNRQYYSGINALGGASDTLASQLTISQFDIRVNDHLQAMDAIKRLIADKCGYSPQHLGLQPQSQGGGPKTATEVVADFTASELTRDKKGLYAKPALAKLSQVALAIDAVVFPGKGGGFYEELPEVEFAPISQIDVQKNATVVQLLYASESATRKTRVQIAHPDWDDEQVKEEADQLEIEFAAAPLTPMMAPDFGPDGDTAIGEDQQLNAGPTAGKPNGATAVT
jgi:hypothetical protein